MGKIPNFKDSERFKTPKTDFLLKFYKDKEFYQLGSRYVDLQNTEERATLIKAVHSIELPCLIIEHTKNPEEQLEHCLISARKIVWGDSLSVSVATHYKLWAGMAKWLLKI